MLLIMPDHSAELGWEDCLWRMPTAEVQKNCFSLQNVYFLNIVLFFMYLLHFFFFASYSNVPICAFQALAVLTLKATKELLNFCHAVLLSNMEGEEIP